MVLFDLRRLPLRGHDVGRVEPAHLQLLQPAVQADPKAGPGAAQTIAGKKFSKNEIKIFLASNFGQKMTY